MIYFGSDNMAPAAPEILSHLAEISQGPTYPYGDDDSTARVTAKIQEIFETDCAVYPVTTGTIANCMLIAHFCPPWGAVLLHEGGHPIQDESTAPELISGGARLTPLAGENGKISVETLDAYLSNPPGHGIHHPTYSVLLLAQVTELGTVYSLPEIQALCDVAHRYGLKVIMDGARFTNALVSLGCTPAEMTWKAGIDGLSFGATKNGAMAAEAVVLFDKSTPDTLPFHRKRTGHLWSKGRYIAGQLEAYLQEDRWLAWARNANEMATRLHDGLIALDSISPAVERQANEVFLHIPAEKIEALKQQDIELLDWPLLGDDAYRLIAAWNTTSEEVDQFIEAVAAA